MRKIITTTFVSMDGVMQAPGGSKEDTAEGFKYGGWQFGRNYDDPITDALMKEFFTTPFELLLGKVTYDIFAAYWPTAKADNEVAVPFNSTKKYVVSHTPQELSWNNSFLITGDVVAELKKLKAEDGPNLWVWGSGNLIQTLLANDLVDTMHILTYPLIIGSGKRLFEEGARPQGFRMIDSKISPAGVVIATYEPAGMFKMGTIGE